MGRKINPTAFRTGHTYPWASRWFDPRNAPTLLAEDVALRSFLLPELKKALIEHIDIERTANRLFIIIAAARPGMILGRGGAGIEEIRKKVIAKLQKLRKKKDIGDLKIEIQEVPRPESHAGIVCQQIADQLERRLPFRRIMKQTISKVVADKSVQGVKVRISGRLGGAEMSRSEALHQGKIPLHTIRANIDYAQCLAKTTYGILGIKTWIYKGEVLREKQKPKE